MSEHNFSAAMQMTMSSVVRNYLRWFELKKCKENLPSVPLFPVLRNVWQRYVLPRLDESSVDVTLGSEFLADGGGKSRDGLKLAGKGSESADDF
jgi:hypothetical protein